MEFKFRQELTEEDFLVFYKLYLMKTFLRPVNIVFIAVFFIVLLIGPFVGSPQTAYYAIGLALFIVGLYFYMGKQGKKLYNRDPESFFMDYVVDENQCSFSSKDGKSTKLWSEFFNLHEVDGYVFIYLKNKRGLIFKRDLIGEDAFHFIINRCSRDLKPKNIVRYKKKQ